MVTTLPDAIEWTIKGLKSDGLNQQYHRYDRYLRGKHPLQFATAKYQSAFGQLLQALAYDRTNMIVDALADRLQVIGFTGKGTAGKEALALWDANSMDRREGEVETEALGKGDAYLIVEKHPRTGKVHYWPNDADRCRIFYSEEEPGQTEFGTKFWKLDSGYMRLNVYRRDRIEKYISRTKITSGVPTSAKVFEEFKVDGEAWPVMLDVTDTVPMFHIGNNARTGGYGQSELLHALPMQDALNKTLGDLMVAMELGAFPQKVILGVDRLPPAQTPEGEEARKKLNEFELGMDRILTVIGQNARIAEFQAVALAQFIATAEFFDKTISRVTRVPVHYLSMTADFPSGTAERLAETPFVAKIENRQRARGEIYGNASAYGLRLNGVADPGEITPVWKSAAPLSIEEELDMAMKQRGIGVPLEYVLKGISTIEKTDIPKIITMVARSREEAARAFNSGALTPTL
ncbi:MAG: phage portal protein, partial [Chloroflexia bacterium]|nr:phage portal protein [Chloroflexia bacterium]